MKQRDSRVSKRRLTASSSAEPQGVLMQHADAMGWGWTRWTFSTLPKANRCHFRVTSPPPKKKRENETHNDAVVLFVFFKNNRKGGALDKDKPK